MSKAAQNIADLMAASADAALELAVAMLNERKQLVVALHEASGLMGYDHACVKWREKYSALMAQEPKVKV